MALVLLAAGLLLAGCASGPEAPTEEAGDAPAADASEAPGTSKAPQAPEAPETAEAPEAGKEPEAEAGEEAPAVAERTGDGLGLSREQIVAVLTRYDLAADAFDPLDLGDGREVLAASFPETIERQVLWVGIFGGAAEPHTVRIDFYPDKARGTEAQAVGDAIDRLLVALLPEWPDADRWPELAGNRAWQETAKLMEDESGAPPRAPVVEGQQDGVWLAALGVPPQVVSYVVTTRDACRPSQADGFYQGYPACR